MTREAGGRAVSDVVTPLLVGQLEAVLFASDAPLPIERIAEVLEISPLDARAALDALRLVCDESGRGLSVVEVGGGWRLVTRPEHAGVLVSLQRLRLKSRLSRAAVETLTIVAYRQPISRPEIEQLRGVGSDSVVTHLLERRLIRVVGRKETPGRPVLYGTTREFLEHFGLRDLDELPPFEPPADASGEGPVKAASGETGAPDGLVAEGSLDMTPAGEAAPERVEEERGRSSPA